MDSEGPEWALNGVKHGSPVAQTTPTKGVWHAVTDGLVTAT